MYKIIDLFCGVGGLSYGFAHDSEFEVVAANEILPNMAAAYMKNHPGVRMYNKDIRELSFEEMKRDLGLSDGDIDVVVGGPPCQAYSTIGKRLIDDPRGKLFQEYFRIIREVSPKAFIFENVRGLLSMMKGDLIKQIIGLFESLGYVVRYKVLNAADYGAPQIRERVIIVGSKMGVTFEYPRATHYDPNLQSLLVEDGMRPYVTLGDAIGDLDNLGNGEVSVSYSCEPQNDYQRLMRRNAPSEVRDHEVPRNNDKMVRLMNALPDGGSPLDLPEEMRPMSGFANTYCRLWWNRPSTTITRNLGCPSSSRCIHPRSPRSLSTREGARLQGFPDDYVFCGPRADKNLQIGNAVPTFLSVALMEAMKQHLKGEGNSSR